MARNDLIILQRGSQGLRSLLRTPGLVACYLPWLQIAQGLTGQTLIDYSPAGNHAQLGSTAGEDTNDPAWGTNGLTCDGSDDYFGMSECPMAVNTDWSVMLAIKPVYNTSVGVLFSIADKTDAVSYENFYLRDGACNFASVKGSDISGSSYLSMTTDGTVSYILLAQSYNGTITFKRLDTGASVTEADKHPTTTNWLTFNAFRYAPAAMIYPTGQSTFFAILMAQRAYSTVEQVRLYANLKTLLAGQGVSLA